MPARGLMVATPSLARELEAQGFERVLPWTRGVDTALFRPRPVRLFGDGPVFLYVGRIAAEKNIAAFLDLDLPGRKVVVGGGPQLDELSASISRRAVHRQEDRRGAGRVLCLGRRVRVPEPHRYLRHGAARGDGLRAARCRAARMRAARRRDDGVTGVLSHDLRAAALAALASTAPACAPGRPSTAGRMRRGCSSPTSPAPASTARRGRNRRASCRWLRPRGRRKRASEDYFFPVRRVRIEVHELHVRCMHRCIDTRETLPAGRARYSSASLLSAANSASSAFSIATRSCRQRHPERPEFVELFHELKVQLVAVLRLVLHASQQQPELRLDVFKCHVPFLVQVAGRPEIIAALVTDYSTGKSKNVPG